MASKRSFAAQIDQRAAQANQGAQDEPAAGAVANDQAGAAKGQPEAAKMAPDFQKYTVPIRTDQLREMATLIARLQLDHGVELSRAIMIRYGLSLVLQAAKEEPGRLLQQLAAFESEELAMNADRKYSLSPGLARLRDEQK